MIGFTVKGNGVSFLDTAIFEFNKKGTIVYLIKKNPRGKVMMSALHSVFKT